MAVKASGSSLSFSEIETEFGQNSDRDLGEYRVSQTVGALSNQPLDEGIPQGTSPIKFSDFYSKRLNVVIDYHSGSTENRPTVAKTRYDAAAGTGTHTVIGGFKTRPANSGGTKTRIHINKTIGSSNSNVNNCAVRTGTGWNTGTVLTVEIGSSGALYGAGGNGGEAGTSDGDASGDVGGTGSSGLGIQYSGTIITNNGSINAGYGGGGGGGYRKVEREEMFSGPVYAAAGGGGGGGQGLPGGEGLDGGADGTISAGGNGGTGGENSQAHGGGGGGGAGSTPGEGGLGGNGNNGTDGTGTVGGNGASGTHTGSIEGENNVTGSGANGGGSGAAIRRSSSSIEITYAVSGTINGDISATGVS